MIHLNEKTWQLPDTGMTFPFPTTNILMYLCRQSETITYDLSMPTTPLTYDYDPTCCTFSNTTDATTNYTYDPGNSSINTVKTSSPYNYDNICGLHPCESRSTDNATYVDSWVYYYGYRYYSPELGRWVSRDPIGEDGGSNVYAFVQNTPINTPDALGFCEADTPDNDPCCCCCLSQLYFGGYSEVEVGSIGVYGFEFDIRIDIANVSCNPNQSTAGGKCSLRGRQGQTVNNNLSLEVLRSE